ncbi:hypothetical protein [Amycolatopsis sp. cg9]|uniref:hypothetical protein n=1 Tax=Amycolatopsis sp. cg9 TaxID=3238801 RepID=UPI0035241618
MKTARAFLALPGLAALAWGVVLFAEYALPVRPDAIATAAWIVGGPIVNDGVIAPLTAVLGIVLSRLVPSPWKAPVVAGTVITGVLAIVAFPLLWRPYGTPPMPGLHDGNPTLGLTLTVAAVWLAVIATGLTIRIARTRSRAALPATVTAAPEPPPSPAAPPRAPADHPGTPPASPSTPEDHPGTPPAPPGK